MPEEYRPRLRQILRDYVLAGTSTKPGISKVPPMAHEFKDPHQQPTDTKQYPAPLAKQQIIESLAHGMRDAGIVRPSRSAWNSPVLLVKKPDGSWRFCVDLRKVNAVLERDGYQPARLENILEALRDAKVFTTLDLCAGFHQLPLAEETKPLTAFTTLSGMSISPPPPPPLAAPPFNFSVINTKFVPVLSKRMEAPNLLSQSSDLASSGAPPLRRAGASPPKSYAQMAKAGAVSEPSYRPHLSGKEDVEYLFIIADLPEQQAFRAIISLVEAALPANLKKPVLLRAADQISRLKSGPAPSAIWRVRINGSPQEAFEASIAVSKFWAQTKPAGLSHVQPWASDLFSTTVQFLYSGSYDSPALVCSLLRVAALGALPVGSSIESVRNIAGPGGIPSFRFEILARVPPSGHSQLRKPISFQLPANNIGSDFVMSARWHAVSDPTFNGGALSPGSQGFNAWRFYGNAKKAEIAALVEKRSRNKARRERAAQRKQAAPLAKPTHPPAPSAVPAAPASNPPLESSSAQKPAPPAAAGAAASPSLGAPRAMAVGSGDDSSVAPSPSAAPSSPAMTSNGSPIAPSSGDMGVPSSVPTHNAEQASSTPRTPSSAPSSAPPAGADPLDRGNSGTNGALDTGAPPATPSKKAASQSIPSTARVTRSASALRGAESRVAHKASGQSLITEALSKTPSAPGPAHPPLAGGGSQ